MASSRLSRLPRNINPRHTSRSAHARKREFPRDRYISSGWKMCHLPRRLLSLPSSAMFATFFDIISLFRASFRSVIRQYGRDNDQVISRRVRPRRSVSLVTLLRERCIPRAQSMRHRADQKRARPRCLAIDRRERVVQRQLATPIRSALCPRKL